jgi:hypothetical protein
MSITKRKGKRKNSEERKNKEGGRRKLRKGCSQIGFF